MLPVLILLASPAAAQSSSDILRGHGIQVTGYGEYRPPADPPEARYAPGMLDRVVREYHDWRLVRATHEICAKMGRLFGIHYALDPSVREPAWNVEVMTEHPMMRTTDGRSAQIERKVVQVTHDERGDGWMFNRKYQLVPGPWTFSIEHDGAVVASVTFEVQLHCDVPIS